MNTIHHITKLAAKVLLSGGLALTAVGLATGSAEANPFTSSPPGDPCPGGDCGSHNGEDPYHGPGHPDLPCPGGSCSGRSDEFNPQPDPPGLRNPGEPPQDQKSRTPS